MQSPYAKLIPTAVLIAILAYLSWSYLEEPAPLGPQAKLPEIEANHLSPPTIPNAERDPFGDSVRFELAEVLVPEKKGRHAATQPTTTTTKTADRTQTASNASSVKGSPGTVASPNPGAPPAPPRAPVVLDQKTGVAGKPAIAGKNAGQNSAAGPVLNATLLHGQQQVAVIDGHTYRQGERLDSSSSAEGCLIAEVHHHRVVLVRDGKVENLTYADRVSSPSSGKAQSAQRAAGPQKGKTPPARPAANARPLQTR